MKGTATLELLKVEERSGKWRAEELKNGTRKVRLELENMLDERWNLHGLVP